MDSATTGLGNSGYQTRRASAVAGVADLDRPGAGGVQSRERVALGQPEHPLGGAQPVQHRLSEQHLDQLGDCWAELASAVAAPGRGAREKRGRHQASWSPG